MDSGRNFVFKNSVKGIFLFFVFITGNLNPGEPPEGRKSFPDYLESIYAISGLSGFSYGFCLKNEPCLVSSIGIYNKRTSEPFRESSMVSLGNYSSILTRTLVHRLIDSRNLGRDEKLAGRLKFLSRMGAGATVGDLLGGSLGSGLDDLLFRLPGNSISEVEGLDFSLLRNDLGIRGREDFVPILEDILLGRLLETIYKIPYSEIIHRNFYSKENIRNQGLNSKKDLITYDYFFGNHFPLTHSSPKPLFASSLLSYGNIRDLVNLHFILKLNQNPTVDNLRLQELGFKENLEFGKKYYFFSGKGGGSNFSILIDYNNNSSYYILTNVTSNNILNNILKNYQRILNDEHGNEGIYSIDKIFSLLSVLELLISIFLIVSLALKIAINSEDKNPQKYNFSFLILYSSILFVFSYYYFLIFPSSEFFRLENLIYSNLYNRVYKADFRIGSILLISGLFLNIIYYYLRISRRDSI